MLLPNTSLTPGFISSNKTSISSNTHGPFVLCIKRRAFNSKTGQASVAINSWSPHACDTSWTAASETRVCCNRLPQVDRKVVVFWPWCSLVCNAEWAAVATATTSPPGTARATVTGRLCESVSATPSAAQLTTMRRRTKRQRRTDVLGALLSVIVFRQCSASLSVNWFGKMGTENISSLVKHGRDEGVRDEIRWMDNDFS